MAVSGFAQEYCTVITGWPHHHWFIHKNKLLNINIILKLFSEKSVSSGAFFDSFFLFVYALYPMNTCVSKV